MKAVVLPKVQAEMRLYSCKYLHVGGAIVSGTLVCALIGSAIAARGEEKAARPDGAKIFQGHCAECHAGGGNAVMPKTPLKGSKKLAAYAVFKAYLSEPMGHMPYYAHLVHDDTALKALYNYVKKMK